MNFINIWCLHDFHYKLLQYNDIDWLIDWLLFNVNSEIFQLYHVKNKLIFYEIKMSSALYKTKTLPWIFIVLAHWNNSLWIDMSPHSDTLS